MLHGTGDFVKINHNGKEIEVVECMHWNLGDSGAECRISLDVLGCSTCPSFAAKPIHKPVPKLRGAGDLIASITKAVGIQPCGGCKQRQELLNQIVPFGKKEDNAEA